MSLVFPYCEEGLNTELLLLELQGEVHNIKECLQRGDVALGKLERTTDSVSPPFILDFLPADWQASTGRETRASEASNALVSQGLRQHFHPSHGQEQSSVQEEASADDGGRHSNQKFIIKGFQETCNSFFCSSESSAVSLGLPNSSLARLFSSLRNCRSSPSRGSS